MKKRIEGIDLARAFAILGMILVNFRIVFGNEGNSVLNHCIQFLEGKASASFVVLAGIGIALLSKKAIKICGTEMVQTQRKLLKRAIFLFCFGILFGLIYPPDIIQFYGIYILISLLFLKCNSKQLLLISALLIIFYPFTMFFYDYETGWNLLTLEYTDFWTLKGFFRKLFLNGFHPVFPWVTFMIFGIWLGRKELSNLFVLKNLFFYSISIFIGLQIIALLGKNILLMLAVPKEAIIFYFFDTGALPPLPLYMLNAISFSTSIISLCLLIGNRYKQHKVVNYFSKTGRMAFTIYVAHILIGVGLIDFLLPEMIGQFSILASFSYSIFFFLLCSVFSFVWNKFYRHGPIEWFMRKVSQ